MAWLPDWRLPPGVSRHLWDYTQDPALAQNYDADLAGTPLLQLDLAFCARHFPQPGRLLDLGCGTGRLLLPFAERGWWVLGVDLSAAMLGVAGAKAAAAGVTIHRLRANLVELDCLAEHSFDHAACLFSTLGMVQGAEHRERVLRHVARVLRPGGRFVLHVHNRWFSLWDRAGRWWLLRDGIVALLGRRSGGDRPMPPHQGLAGLTLHLFTRREVLDLLQATGFRVLEVQPVGLGPKGRVGWPAGLRAYGYLIAAEVPGA